MCTAPVQWHGPGPGCAVAHPLSQTPTSPTAASPANNAPAPNPVWDFVFGGLNYQVEHHLFPTMPRVNFSRARKLVMPFCAGHDLHYEEMGAFASYRLVVAELRRVARAASAPGAV